MYKLIELVIKNRKITLFLTAIIALLGLYAYYLLPRQESPDVSAPVAMIVTTYPGAPADDVKDLVTKKIEDELNDLDGYDYCKGISKENVSIVTVYFLSNIDNEKAMQDVRNTVLDVQQDLPAGALASTVNTDLAETAGIVLSLSGANYSYDQLESFADIFKDQLRDVNGIAKVKIVGKLDKQVQVDLSIARLNQLGLSFEDICTILAAQNVQIPSGNIDYPQGKISVTTPGSYRSLEDIKNTIIAVSPDNGVVTRLRDIAEVHLETEEGVQKIKANGADAVLLTGYFVANQNVVLIGKEVRQVLEEVKANLPPDLKVQEIIYQPDTVSNTTNEFMFHLLLGILLVLFIVFWGLGLRNALVVSTAIPLSILATFCMMYLNGVQIHQVSLVSLIIALGILVDDAIVVCDNVQVNLDQGADRSLAAYVGTTRCTVPNLSATVAIIVAFAPLLGIPGPAGQFMHAIPWVLIVSVTASYFVAMFVVPSLMASFARPVAHSKLAQTGKLRLFFRRLLEIGLRHKKATVAGALAGLAFAVFIVMPQLTSQFFPYVDKDFLVVEINSEKAGDLEAAEQLADQVQALLQQQPEIKDCTLSVGDGIPKFYITMLPAKPMADYAQILAKFDLAAGTRFTSQVELASYIQHLLDQNISNGKCRVMLMEYAMPTDAKVIVRITGQDIATMTQVSAALQKEIAKLKGTANIRDNWLDDSLQIKVELDDDKASNFGISKYDVQKEINMALYGYNASIYRKDSHAYTIRVQGNIQDVAMLENFKIKSTLTGHKIPLKEIAAIGYSSKINTLNTYNGDLAVEILADPLPGYDAPTIENQIENELVPKMDLKGTKISYAGEREDIKENFTALAVLAIAAIFLIYIILLIVFKSFIQPLVILTTIPLSLIGSVIGLYIFNQPLSLTAFLGVIALIGLVVKNGILLIDFINEARSQGAAVDDACREAVGKRFNAVILSALTVILALIPLALSGSSLFTPMAVALMSGLTVATFLTMVVVPVIYSLIEGKRTPNKEGAN